MGQGLFGDNASVGNDWQTDAQGAPPASVHDCSKRRVLESTVRSGLDVAMPQRRDGSGSAGETELTRMGELGQCLLARKIDAACIDRCESESVR
jgi:hypothetical protein